MASHLPQTDSNTQKAQSMSVIPNNIHHKLEDPHIHRTNNPKNKSKNVIDPIDISPEIKDGPPLPANQWIDSPLLMCVHTHHKHYINTEYDKQIAIPINTIFNFESDSFKGKCIVRVTGMPNTEKSYFENRKRKMDVSIQGVFKKRIRYDRVYTGQCFDKPFRHIPGQYLVAAGLKLVKSLAPALRAEVDCETPHLISPWASACQTFNVSKPGTEIPLPAEPIENVELIDPKFAGLTFTQRKQLFNDLELLKKYYFEPGLVYTMSFYSHMFYPTTYSLHMLRMKWGVHQYITSPVQINAIIIPDECDNTLKDSTDDIIAQASSDDITKAFDQINNNNIKDETINTDINDNSTNNNIENENEKPNTTVISNDNQNKDKETTTNNDNNNDTTTDGRARNMEVVNGTSLTDEDSRSDTDEKANSNEQKNNSIENNSDSNDNKDNTTNNHFVSNQNGYDEDGNLSLLNCEMIYCFHVWHTDLVEELYNIDPKTGQKKTKRSNSRSSLSSYFSRGSTPIHDNNENENENNSNQSIGNGNANGTINNDNTKKRKPSLLGGMFGGKKWK